MNVLVVGGSSGLGLEMAKLFRASVFVTGRSVRQALDGLQFRRFAIDGDLNLAKLEAVKLILGLPKIDTLVYAAGNHREGSLTEVSTDSIIETASLGLEIPAILLQAILKKQGELDGFIPISSTAQTLERVHMNPNAALYAASKAALRAFSRAMAFDGRIKKTLLVAPAGMNTDFWRNVPERVQESFLSPQWVAEQILTLWQGDYRYRDALILREPPRVEVTETS